MLPVLAPRGACGLQFGGAQLAVLVGVGTGKPFVAALLGTGLAVGLVDVTILVDVHAFEERTVLGGTDTPVLVAVHHHLETIATMTAMVAPHATVAVTTTRVPARQFLARQLAVLVLVQCIEALKARAPMPIDIFDAVTWSAITPLSEQSIANGFQTLAFPDFTGGAWRNRKPIFAFDASY